MRIVSVGGEEVEEEVEEDSHMCGKCRKVFTRLETYIQHKVQDHAYRVRYNKLPSSKLMVPTLQERKPGVRPVGRPRKTHTAAHSSQPTEGKSGNIVI